MAGSSLNERTLHLLRDRPRYLTYERLAQEIAPACQGVTATWLFQYVNGRTAFPHVDRVQAVYEFLSGNKLFVD